MSEIRAALEKAFNDQEDEESTEEQTEMFEDAPEPSLTEVENPEVKTEPEHQEKEEETPEAEPSPLEVEADKKVEEAIKAPASWTPKARETWGKLPKEAQAEIAKREKQITDTLAQTAQQRNFVKQVNDTLAPYREGLIAAGVKSPLEAIDVLFRTEASLRVGSPHTKAKTIADMIKQYGVDIQTLDSLLAGEAPQQNPQSELEALLDQRLGPIQQYLSQQHQYAQQQEMTGAHSQVGEFAKNAEFLEDVRMDMADLIDMAAARGQQMTLQQAYDKACAINPEISKVMAERQRQQQLMGNKQNTDRKRHAAVSVTGREGGQMAKGEADTLRGAIEAAWDAQMAP